MSTTIKVQPISYECEFELNKIKEKNEIGQTRHHPNVIALKTMIPLPKPNKRVLSRPMAGI